MNTIHTRAVETLLETIAERTRLNKTGNFHEYEQREDFCKTWAWAIPSLEALQAIVNFAGGKTILEIGCGKGLWAHLLQLMGANVIATDISVPVKQFAESIIEIDAEAAVQSHYADVLFTCWPAYNESHTAKALKAFDGSKLVYIGEGYGGCTGCDEFHGEINKNWGDPVCISIPQWFGLHDRLHLFTRKEQ